MLFGEGLIFLFQWHQLYCSPHRQALPDYCQGAANPGDAQGEIHSFFQITGI
jgi:hypothetical protein